MDSHISATEAARTFSDLLNRIRYRGESFVVERGGEAICRIAPAGAALATVTDLVRLLRAAPRPDDGYLDLVEEVARDQPKLPGTPWRR